MKLISCILALLGVFLTSEAKHVGLNSISKTRHNFLPDGRIIGGSRATDSEAKYMVNVQMHNYVNNGNFRCGGTVISDRFVLTAAHCLVNIEYAVLTFGNHDLRQPAPVHKNCSADSFIIHEDGDIGLVKLPGSPLPVGNGVIEKVELATSRNDADYLNQRATTYGWGRTSDDPNNTGSPQLLYVDVNVETCNHCPRNETCISGAGIKGTCGGDSGGPLVLQNGKQFGVTSWGYGYCEQGFQSVFVSVYKYLDWIKKHANVP